MKRLSIVSFIFLVLSLPAFAGQTFSNEDLKKYKLPSDKESTGPPETIVVEERDPAVEEIEEVIKKSDQDYWCRMGNSYRNKIAKAEKNFKEAKDRLDKYGSIGYGAKHMRAKKSYRHAKEKLEEAKDRLRELEDRAYRQSIPASWYRCQYD